MSRRTVRGSCIGVALFALQAGTLNAQAPKPHFTDQLAWLAGCWERRNGASVVEEHWLAPRAGVMLGLGRTVRNDSLREFEFTRIFERGDTLVYAAQPSGQAAAEFRALGTANRAITFENLAHDFPQRVMYRAAAGTDSLLARIEGTIGGRARSADFPYRRVPCPGPVAP